MKKIILIYCSVLTSCMQHTEEEILQRDRERSREDSCIVKIRNEDFIIVTIDSCEYIYHDRYYSESLIHKANCKNH